MKRFFSLLSAGLVLSFIFVSCSMFEDAGERATSKVSFEISSELFRSVIENSRNNNSNHSRELSSPGEYYETIVTLSGSSYNDTRTSSINAGELKNGLPDSFKSQKFDFNSVPIGITVKAEVSIDLVSIFEEDNGKLKEFRETNTGSIDRSLKESVLLPQKKVLTENTDDK